MKKYLFLLSVIGCLCATKGHSQNIRVPNGSFEIWDTLATLTVPDSWPSSDLLWYFDGYNTHNVYPDRHSHSGKYSASIGPDTAAKKIWPGFIAAKFALNQRVKYVTLHYIDSLNSAESGVVQISLFKGNEVAKDSIGGAVWNFPDSTIKEFILAEIPLVYTSADTTVVPDSISINIEVVSASTALPSGHIAVDDIGLWAQKPASIQSPVGSGAFRIFPNPSSNGGIYIVSSYLKDYPSRVEISDLNGRLIYSQYLRLETSPRIDLSANPPGLYFVKILSGENVSVNKVILSH